MMMLALYASTCMERIPAGAWSVRPRISIVKKAVCAHVGGARADHQQRLAEGAGALAQHVVGVERDDVAQREDERVDVLHVQVERGHRIGHRVRRQPLRIFLGQAVGDMIQQRGAVASVSRPCRVGLDGAGHVAAPRHIFGIQLHGVVAQLGRGDGLAAASLTDIEDSQ